MIIETRLVRLVGACAVTAFPFIFVEPGQGAQLLEVTLRHEGVHLRQQRRWFVYGLGVGLLAWHFLYLFCLPFGVNPWRRKWETEAFREGERYLPVQIDAVLSRPPYYLWR